MKLVSSPIINSEIPTPWVHCEDRTAAGEIFRPGFELCVVALDADGDGVYRASSAMGRSLLVNLPAIISSSDLKQAKAATENSWYVLSGGHHSSTLLLKLKSGAVARAQKAVERVVARGEQVAILLDGEIVGVLVFQNSLTGSEIAIDASFFSEGTEKEKGLETRRLAQQINATLF